MFGYNKLGGDPKRIETFIEQPKVTPPPLKYTFAIIGILLDKDYRVREWIEHHRWQGVDHFYLIDEGSNGDFWTYIETYVRQGVVTIVPISNEQTKEKKLDAAYQRYRRESKWFAVIDMDTFLYPVATNKDTSLVSVLEKEYRNNVAGLYIYGNVFGSRANVDCVRKDITSRHIRPRERPASIVRSRYTSTLRAQVHDHQMGNIMHPSNIKANIYDEKNVDTEFEDTVLKNMVTTKFKNTCF